MTVIKEGNKSYRSMYLFQQSNLSRDFDVQKTLFDLFKYSCDVMQVGALSAQLGLVSGLADWY